MNQKISWKLGAGVIAITLAICAFVYSRLPTGMVLHTTGKMGKRGGGGGPGMMRNHPGSQSPPRAFAQKGAVKGKDIHSQKGVAKGAGSPSQTVDEETSSETNGKN